MTIRFSEIARMKDRTLLRKFLPRFLEYHGYKIKHGDFYLYGKGSIPVLISAHVDTVFEHPPTKIFYDKKFRVYFSPDGLGADDRAGVYAILRLLSEDFRPYVLFTNFEESGQIGAREFALAEKREWNVIFAIDREGKDQAAVYNCTSPELHNFLELHGFKIVRGTVSDISILCPKFGIAGANLSAGFYNNHTTGEYFDENALESTLAKLRRILKDPPKNRISYTDDNEDDEKEIWMLLEKYL